MINPSTAVRRASGSTAAGATAVASAAGVSQHWRLNATLSSLPIDPQYFEATQRLVVATSPAYWKSPHFSPSAVQVALLVQEVPELESMTLCPSGTVAALDGPLRSSLAVSAEALPRKRAITWAFESVFILSVCSCVF